MAPEICAAPPAPFFFVNGKRMRSFGPKNMSLNEFIRQHTPFKGTKLACGEGGCGSCAVQVTRYDPGTDSMTTSSINSCLCPVGSLDGVLVTTAEGLGNHAAGFSIVQEQLARHHGSQCGFCTPGFTVACHAAIAGCSERDEEVTPEALMQGLDGNLCRCTGYRPILDACRGMAHDIEDMGGELKCADPFPEELKCYVKAKASVPSSGTQRESLPLSLASLHSHGPHWISPHSVDDAFAALEGHQGAMLLSGNTAAGVYHEWPDAPCIVSLAEVRELREVRREQDAITFGAAVPFADMIREMRRALDGKRVNDVWLKAADHLERIAGSHVRWAATPGGNLALLKNPKYYLESDFATVLAGVGGRVRVASMTGRARWMDVTCLLEDDTMDLGKSDIITAVTLPAFTQNGYYWSHKVAQRYYNAHALVNLAASWRRAESGGLSDVRIAVGCPLLRPDAAGKDLKPAWHMRRATTAESLLETEELTTDSLIRVLRALQVDISPCTNSDAPEEFYRATMEGLLFQALAAHVTDAETEGGDLERLLTARTMPPPPVPSGRQVTPEAPAEQRPVGLPVEKDRIRLQASGEAQYSSDVGVGGGQLYASVVGSSKALAKIKEVDASEALKIPGVKAFVGPNDIPGENRVFLGGEDAEIFASEKVEYVHQPLGLVVAETPQLAKKAASLVKVSYEHSKTLGEPLFTIKDAIAADSFYEIPDGGGGKVHKGDCRRALADAKNVIKGARYIIPSQQHFYMETQAAVAEPCEGGTFLVHASTQTIDGVQAAVARALGLQAHCVTAVCRRAGGGFGGKVARSLPVAAAAAVAASKVGQAVHYQLSRNEDFRMNGGRSEAEIEYDVGFDDAGKISALAVRGWFLAGADIDLAWNDMMILQTGADQVYDIRNIDLDLRVVRTNLPPRTIMRGPGFMDAVMVIEQVLEHVAAARGLAPEAVRRGNFLRAPTAASAALQHRAASTIGGEDQIAGTSSVSGSSSIARLAKAVCARALPATSTSFRNATAHKDPSFMKTTLSRPFRVEFWTLPRIWEGLLETADYANRLAEVSHFNIANAWRKRGLSINPCRFDSAPQPMTAYVNVYFDGSVLITHGGLEVGQGLSTKVKQMAAFELSKLLPEEMRPLPLDIFRVNDTRSDIVPNCGPTWSSTGSEASCAAVQEACKQLVGSLAEAAAGVKERKSAQAFWQEAISKVHTQVGFAPSSKLLSAVGFFDGKSRRGGDEPLVYSSFGAAVAEVELDILTGEKLVRRCDIHFDCGQSLNPMIDMGQVEGAFIQGLGYLTSEEVKVDEKTGRLITDGTWKYKPPAANCIPQQLNVEFLKDSPNPKGVLSSKASGEPSLLLSVSVLYALRHAVVAARREVLGSNPAADVPSFFSLPAPATTVNLKQACGTFRVSDLLRAAQKRPCSLDSCGSWVKVAAP